MSLVSEPFFGWVPDVHKKLDTKQISFKIPQELLALTRKILFKRYACDIGNRQGFSVRWIDQDKHNTDIKITDSVDLTDVPTSLPCDKLYKSKIQVNSDSQKLVTISVYYTTGTVLVQGVKCRTWLKDEFDVLIQVIRAVYAFVGCKKYPGLENAVRECLSTLPIPSATELLSWKGGISDCSPQNTPLRPLMSKLTLLATLLLPTDKECPAAVFPPDPFPSPQQSGGDQPSADSCLPDMPSSSMPSGCKQPSLSPLPHTSSSPLQTSPSSPLQTAPTEMEPESPNAQLEASPQAAHHITPRTTPEPSKVLRKTSTYLRRARPTKHQVTRPSRPTKPTKRPVTRPSRLEQKLDTILTFFKCASQQLIPFLQDFERLKKDNNSLKAELQNVRTLVHSLQTSTPTPPAISLLSPSKPRDAPKEPTSTIDFIAVPTSNRFAVLQGQDEDKEESEDTDIVVCTDVHVAADESVYIPNSTNIPSGKDRADSPCREQLNGNSLQTPRQQLAECRVRPGISNVLIGDSVVSSVKPDLVFSAGNSQNISVSGITIEDLLHWLHNIPRNKDVRRVVFHVGMNTCKSTTIAETTWRQLVRNFRRVFPQAQLTASAMVPPMGQHYLKGTVATSNISLLKVCQGEDVRCVDHTASFTAYSGAPKQDMYRDPLHPSAKGTGRLACNIKYADRPRQRPALLKTPGPTKPGQFQTRQQGANAWQSVPGRLPSMTTPPSQQPGYTNVQRQPYCLMASSCPPHHHLPADNGYPPPPYYPYSIAPRRRVDTQSPDDVFEPRLDGYRSTAQPICHPISAFHRQHITHMYAAETLV